MIAPPNDDDDSLVTETRRLIAARPDVVLVTTGYGMRRWFEVADAAGLGADLTAVLQAARIFARGPKAHGAVRAAGLLNAETSDLDTMASLVDAAIAARLSDRRVAVQLHGYTDEVALRRLTEISDCVMTVTPYRWAQPDPPDRLTRLIKATCHRQVETRRHIQRFQSDEVIIELRGRQVLVDDRRISLGPNSLAYDHEAGLPLQRRTDPLTACTSGSTPDGATG
jgi:uroporphyrinogen-III synthase